MFVPFIVGLAIDFGHAQIVAQDEQRQQMPPHWLEPFTFRTISQAQTQADSIAAANGFTDGCACGGKNVSVTIGPNTNAGTRTLEVIVAEKVQMTFLQLFGIHTISVGRSAVATYDNPIELGAPDQYARFWPYPTTPSLCAEPM